jgi:hypothetical protein
MPQNISDGKVTCWNCHNSVANLQFCEICGANPSQGVQSTSPTQSPGQSFGPAGETALGNPPQMARLFPSSPTVTPATPPEADQQTQPWQPFASVTPPSSPAVAPATSPEAGQQPKPWQPFASVTPPSSPSVAQGFPTGPSTGWRPPGPLNPANISTPNDAIDTFLRNKVPSTRPITRCSINLSHSRRQ